LAGVTSFSELPSCLLTARLVAASRGSARCEAPRGASACPSPAAPAQTRAEAVACWHSASLGHSVVPSLLWTPRRGPMRPCWVWSWMESWRLVPTLHCCFERQLKTAQFVSHSAGRSCRPSVPVFQSEQVKAGVPPARSSFQNWANESLTLCSTRSGASRPSSRSILRWALTHTASSRLSKASRMISS
jgi:hypothetical protein